MSGVVSCCPLCYRETRPGERYCPVCAEYVSLLDWPDDSCQVAEDTE